MQQARRPGMGDEGLSAIDEEPIGLDALTSLNEKSQGGFLLDRQRKKRKISKPSTKPELPKFLQIKNEPEEIIEDVSESNQLDPNEIQIEVLNSHKTSD